MSRDHRLFGRMTIGYTHHPKIFILSDRAFRCWHELLDYCREQQTDGFVARRYATARWSLDVLHELCDNDPEKPSLTEADEGWYARDYLAHNPSRAEIEARSERNRQAGQQGGLAKAKRTASAPLSAPLSENLPYIDKEEDKEGRGTALPPKCSRHPNGNPKDEPCTGCGRVREWQRARDAEVAADELAAKRRRLELIADCPDCHGTNTIAVGDDAAAKCEHPKVNTRK